MIKRFALFLSLLLLPQLCWAQNKPIFQSGVSTPGHLLKWITNGVAGDAGGSLGGTATELGLLNTGTPFCISDAPVSSGNYHQLCLGANVFGTEGLISFNAYGTAPPLPLVCMINGASYSCINNGSGNVVGGPPTVTGDLACWNNTTGTALTDCGPRPTTGITQLTGPVTAGPGSGSQATTITPTGVTPGTYTCPTETLNAAGQVISATSGACGGIGIPNSPLVSGNGTSLGNVALGTGLSLTGTFPTQTLNATGGGGGGVSSITFLPPLTGGTITSTGSAGLGNVPVSNLNSGTGASVSTFWRGDGTWATPSGGGGGITQLTTDVLAGPGSGSVAATVAGLQGRPLSSTPPGSGQCLGWNGSTWLPVACGTGGGITSLSQGAGITLTPNPITSTGTVSGSGMTTQITVANACTGASCTPAISCQTFTGGVLTLFSAGACAGTAANRMLIQAGSAFLIQAGSSLLIQ